MASAAAVSGAAFSGGNMAAQAATPGKEFYQLRKYELRNGPQTASAQKYFSQALIPALNRMGMPQIGTFQLSIGPETPTYYVLIPSTNPETLLTLNMKLAADAEFSKAAADFWGAPATAPAFQREEVTMMSAFAGFPKLIAPKPGKRIFQLRTYESPSNAAHLKKVEMFETGEIAIFQKNGLTPVFFAHNLIGPRLPSLTYMLTFADVAELNAHWSAFGGDPTWKELSHKPGYTDPEIVSNIANLYLSPLASSQI
ncbi:MAG: NIPSNAP family protein [Janthinobacterium lividum]